MRNQIPAVLAALIFIVLPAVLHGQEIRAKDGDTIEVRAGGKDDSVAVTAARESKYFIWSPRLQSDNWHAGIAITNWKDDFDQPHDEWPGRRGDEIVRIDDASVVIDKEPVVIDRLTASGSLAVNKPMTLFNGRVENMSLAADLTIKESLKLAGKSEWTGRSIMADGSRRNPTFGEMIVAPAASLAISFATTGGAKTLRLHKAFWNNGTVDHGAGELSIVNGASKPVQLFNDKNAVYRLAPGAAITTRTPETVRIVNNGTIAVSGTSREPAVIDPPLIQDGGRLMLGAGPLTLKNGAEFRGGNIAGSGTLELAGGTATAKQQLAFKTPSRLVVSGGVLLIPSGSGLTVEGNGVGFQLQGGAIRASGPVDLGTNWIWAGGAIATSGKLTTRKTVRIGGGNMRRLTGTLENHGTVFHDTGIAIALGNKSSILNTETYRLDGSLTGGTETGFTNEGDLFLGPGASLRMNGQFSNDGEIIMSTGARMKLAGRLKELLHHAGNLPLANPKLPGTGLVLDAGTWTLHDGAEVDAIGPMGFTKILAIGEAATVTLAGTGRINNIPQKETELEGQFLIFGNLILRDGVKWRSGKIRQMGSLYLDKSSSMVIETSPMTGAVSFVSTGVTVIDGKLEVTNTSGTALDDNFILISGKLSGSGTINGKPVNAFDGTVTKPLE